MDNKIRLIKTEQQTVAAINPDRFEFNPRGRFPWLQRWLFKLLAKLGANSLEKSVTYKTVEIDTTRILEALFENQRNVMELYNKRARYVVIGRKDFTRFCSDPEYRDPLYFNFSAPIGINNQRTILGLEVVVVPWIDGFFVLPDLNEERMVRAS